MSADLLGVCRPYQWKGQTLMVAHRDLFVEAVFGDWCAAEAGLLLARLRPRVPADFYAEQMRLYSAAIAGKHFTWDSSAVIDASTTEPGRRHLLWLKIMRGAEKGGAKIPREEIDEIARDPEKWQELLDILWQQDYPDFFRQVQAERGTTTPPPPASTPVSPETSMLPSPAPPACP
jgi:hypothetical protein